MKYVFRLSREEVAGQWLADKVASRQAMTWLDVYRAARKAYGPSKARRLVRAALWWKQAWRELAGLEPGSSLRNRAEKALFSHSPYNAEDEYELDRLITRALWRGPMRVKRDALGLFDGLERRHEAYIRPSFY